MKRKPKKSTALDAACPFVTNGKLSPVGATFLPDTALDELLKFAAILGGNWEQTRWILAAWYSHLRERFLAVDLLPGSDSTIKAETLAKQRKANQAKCCAFLAKFPIAEATLRIWADVHDRLPIEIRKLPESGVSFTHHREIGVYASMPTTERKAWLDKAEANKWTVIELRQALAANGQHTANPTASVPFNISPVLDDLCAGLRKFKPQAAGWPPAIKEQWRARLAKPLQEINEFLAALAEAD